MPEQCFALTGLRARAELTVEVGVGASRLRWRSAPPVVLRPTGSHRVHLVQAAGGPLGGDDLGLTVRLGPGAALQVCSAAASVVQAGADSTPTRWNVTADVADGAVLDWCPEPTVVCDGAQLHSSIAVIMQRGARIVLREVVVLGRADQRGGRFHGALTVECDGEPLLAHTLLLDGADPVLSGPAGTGGARAIGTLMMAGEGISGPSEGAGEQPGLRWACSTLDGPGWLLLALGESPAGVAHFLTDSFLRSGCEPQ